MNLLTIPSESCPECRTPGGNCSILVKELDTNLREQGVKIDEADFRALSFGKRPKSYREAYVVHKYICLKGKGI